MKEIFENLKDIGLATTVIALIAILLVGCIKLIPGVKKIPKQPQKALYQGLVIVISAVLSVVYSLCIAKTGWTGDVYRFAIIATAEVHVLYPMYENLGLRALVRLIGSLIMGKKKKAEVLEEPKEEKTEEVQDQTEWLE